MWLLGHAAAGYLCYSFATRTWLERTPGHLAVLVLLVGTQFPDLIDKPLAWYVGVLPTGRTLTHSLLVLVPLSVSVLVLTRRAARGEYGDAFVVGALSHVVFDALPALWSATSLNFLLWPTLPLGPHESGAPSLVELVTESVGEPYFLLQFGLAAVALVYWRRDGYPGLGVLSGAVGRRHCESP